MKSHSEAEKLVIAMQTLQTETAQSERDAKGELLERAFNAIAKVVFQHGYKLSQSQWSELDGIEADFECLTYEGLRSRLRNLYLDIKRSAESQHYKPESKGVLPMPKIAVTAPNGKRACPYRLEGWALVKRVEPRHIYRERQAVGIDEDVWEAHRDQVELVRFEFSDGRLGEIGASEFERFSFLHGGNGQFALTRFISLARLTMVKPASHKQLALQL